MRSKRERGLRDLLCVRCCGVRTVDGLEITDGGERRGREAAPLDFFPSLFLSA